MTFQMEPSIRIFFLALMSWLLVPNHKYYKPVKYKKY
jgi:hypothetical protein